MEKQEEWEQTLAVVKPSFRLELCKGKGEKKEKLQRFEVGLSLSFRLRSFQHSDFNPHRFSLTEQRTIGY
ncbi:hypothetical protein MRB53_016668 [Persea americana]|uniref:Uncharacterized protein n=1 Tax=Persea americana TaxID=3435 RepID=A0ACC2M3Q5_PERAE|nr:hypothetical protein MRB53_016668 [Persea americana]